MMIIYSIIPNEYIFSEQKYFLEQNNMSESNYLQIEYMGETLEVSPMSNNCFIVNRIISTNPKSFLKTQIQPGKVITLGFQVKKTI